MINEHGEREPCIREGCPGVVTYSNVQLGRKHCCQICEMADRALTKASKHHIPGYLYAEVVAMNDAVTAWREAVGRYVAEKRGE